MACRVPPAADHRRSVVNRPGDSFSTGPGSRRSVHHEDSGRRNRSRPTAHTRVGGLRRSATAVQRSDRDTVSPSRPQDRASTRAGARLAHEGLPQWSWSACTARDRGNDLTPQAVHVRRGQSRWKSPTASQRSQTAPRDDGAKPEQYLATDTKGTASKRTITRDGSTAATPTPSRDAAWRRNGSRGRQPSPMTRTRRRPAPSTCTMPPLYIH